MFNRILPIGLLTLLGGLPPGVLAQAAANPQPSPPSPSKQVTAEPAGRPLPETLPTATERIIKGSDKVLAAPRPPTRLEGAGHSFRFEDAPILDVVHVVLREILKVDYIVHQPVVGSVTMSTRRNVSPDQALALLESALQANGLLLARDQRGTYHVGRAESLRNVVTAVSQAGSGTALPPGYSAVVVPLQYIGASEMATILRPMMPADALVRVDNVRNLLVLAGSRTQAEGWLDIVNTFDVDLLKGMSVGLFPLKHASVREIDAALRLITSAPAPSTTGAAGTGARSGASGTAATAPGAAGAAAAASPTVPEGFPLYGAVRVLPIERLNSVLIVTPRAHYLDEARRWIEKFDQPGLGDGDTQLYVYPVQNGSARHLAEVLNGIFGNTPVAANNAGATGVAPGLNQASTFTGGFATAQQAAGRQQQGVASSSTGAFGANSSFSSMNQTGRNATTPGVISTTVGSSGTRVVADEINNAIIIFGSRSDYQKIEAALRRLDLPPTQVLIEASIVEVSLTDELKYGLQWAFSDSRSGGYNGSGALSTQDGGALAGALKGFSYTLTNKAGAVQAVLNALATKSLVNIISNPSLMVLDNHVAQISVGNQTPIRSSETITEGGNRSTSIQYKDTGVMLSVQPSVNAGDVVTLNINQAVTDVGEVDEPTGQRAFLQRQINSKVAVRSGETIVLGGLIRENTTNGRAGIPVAQDIPFFGALFGSRNTNATRTELLVVITPRVVRSEIDAREVSSEVRDRMKGLLATDLPGWPGAAAPAERRE